LIIQSPVQAFDREDSVLIALDAVDNVREPREPGVEGLYADPERAKRVSGSA